MIKLLLASLLLTSNFVTAQSSINVVNNGQAIQAAKFNEVIEKVNLLSTELEETKNKLAIAEAKVVPVGSVISMAGACPSGYLEANGSSLPRSTNVALFNAIGTVHEDKLMKTDTHFLNLWDDFCEMGEVSHNSITGETHVQIESAGMKNHEEQKQLLSHFLPLFKNFFEPNGVTIELYFYDTKVLYPHMSEELHADRGWRDYSAWQLKLNFMTYSLAEKFMETQKNKVHDYNGQKVVIISES